MRMYFQVGTPFFDPDSNGKTKMKSMFMTFFTQLHFLKIVICEKTVRGSHQKVSASESALVKQCMTPFWW